MCYLGTVVEHKLQWNANTDISFLLKIHTHYWHENMEIGKVKMFMDMVNIF